MLDRDVCIYFNMYCYKVVIKMGKVVHFNCSVI